MMTKSSRTPNVYLVFVKDAYVRNLEIMDTDGLSNEEVDNIPEDYDPYENRWLYIEQSPYCIGWTSAPSAEEAIKKVAIASCYDPRILYAELIPAAIPCEA